MESSSSKRVNCQNIMVRLTEEDIKQIDILDKILSFAQRRNLDGMIAFSDGAVLFSEKKRLRLKSGMATLQKEIGSRYPPSHVKTVANLPFDYINKMVFSEGYDESKVILRHGAMFEEASLKRRICEHVKENSNQSSNATIMSQTTLSLVRSGKVPVENARRIQESKKYVERLETDDNRTGTDLCLGAVKEFEFEQWAVDRSTRKSYKTDRFPPTTVTVHGHAGDTATKLKHYYVYSKLPGFGKSHAMQEFATKTNATIVNDCSNMSNISEKSQFLIFDETSASSKKKHLDIADLKALTGGNAESFSGNKKTYGDSYSTRSDVQIIILSNQSIYELYAAKNSALGRPVICRDLSCQLEDRFFVHRLDGSNEEERLRFVDPMHVSDSELVSIIQLQVDKIVSQHTGKEFSAEYFLAILETALTIYKRKHVYGFINGIEHFVETLERVHPVSPMKHYIGNWIEIASPCKALLSRKKFSSSEQVTEKLNDLLNNRRFARRHTHFTKPASLTESIELVSAVADCIHEPPTGINVQFLAALNNGENIVEFAKILCSEPEPCVALDEEEQNEDKAGGEEDTQAPTEAQNEAQNEASTEPPTKKQKRQ